MPRLANAVATAFAALVPPTFWAVLDRHGRRLGEGRVGRKRELRLEDRVRTAQ